MTARLTQTLVNNKIIPYASRTGTRRNLAALRESGWRLLVSAAGVHRNEGFRYAIDNGAWTAYQQGKTIDIRAFTRILRKMGANADWCVIPDVVAGGRASLNLSLQWMRYVLDECAMGMLAVQDGMIVDDVRDLVGPRVGIFVGGTTQWKLATMGTWAELSRVKNAWCHIARVNSQRRIRLVATAGARSFDGSSASRYAQSLPGLDRAVNAPVQMALKGIT